MDEISLKTISSTAAFIDKLLALEVLSGDVLTEALMAKTALAYEQARAGCTARVISPVRILEQQLAADMAELSEQDPTPAARQWNIEWKGSVGASLTPFMDSFAGQTLEAGQERLITGRLRDFLVQYHVHLDPAIAAGTSSAYQGGRGDGGASEPDQFDKITPAAVQRCLSQVQRYAGTQVIDTRQLMGGYSKETFILHMSTDNGERREVMRKDGIGLPTGSSVVNEFEVLQAMALKGLPVPTPFHLERNTEKLGTAYMLVDYVAGQPAHLTVPQSPALRQRWAQSILDTLVTLHRGTLSVGQDIRDTLGAEIDTLRQRVQDRERHAHPAIAWGLSWLQSHLSDLEGRPACRVHGDVGFHNMLMADNQLVALLDWEFSHISDPVEDLSYVKPFIEQLALWPWFIEQYEQQARIRYDVNAARYFNVWKEVRNAIACQGSLNSLLMPGVNNLALCVAGNLYIPKFEIGILDAILDASAREGEPNV